MAKTGDRLRRVGAARLLLGVVTRRGHGRLPRLEVGNVDTDAHRAAIRRPAIRDPLPAPVAALLGEV